MARQLYLYPLWLRLWHWSNAILFVSLLITGVSMHFAQPGAPQVDFRTARLVHNAAGVLMTAGYVIFLIGNFLSRNLVYYMPEKGDFPTGIIKQIRFYLGGIFTGDPHPFPHSEQRKFNPMQKLSYAVVMYIVFPAIVVTGWVLFFPDRIPDRIDHMPGIGFLALAHSGIGYALSLFMAIHIYLGTTGVTLGSLFKGMLTGYYPAHD